MVHTRYTRDSLKLFFCCTVLFQMLTGMMAAQPKIVLSRKVTTLSPQETAFKVLFTARCTTTPPSRDCAISIRTVKPDRPCGNCFVALPSCPTANEFCVRYIPGQGMLNPSRESQYLITLEARDTAGELSTDIVDVRIITNSPPFFNYPKMSTSEIIRKSESITSGTALYRVLVMDRDNDPLTFSMTTTPRVNTLVIDPLSGVIRTTIDLRVQCINSVSALVSVQDAYNDPVGQFIVNLDFKDDNTPPVLTNLNTEVHILEDEPVDKAVMLITYVDATVYPAIDYTLTVTPVLASGLFYIRGSYLKVKSSLDYETHPKVITLTIRASDGFCLSDTYKLTVKLVDVNEPPVVLPVDQTLETCEGQITVTPTWNITDPDDGDSFRFSRVYPKGDYFSGRFEIDEVTGVIRATMDYDIDQIGVNPTLELWVEVTDQQQLVSRATVSIRFIDCNDNAPVFSKPSKVMTVTPCDAVGVVVGGVPIATDADSDFQNNNAIVYSGSGNGATVEPSGLVVLTKKLELGQYTTFPVYASDQGLVPGPLQSPSPTWISIYSVPCPPTRAPPTNPNGGSDNSGSRDTTPVIIRNTTTIAPNDMHVLTANEGIIIAASLLVAVLILLWLFIYCRYYKKRCRGSRQRQNPNKGRQIHQIHKSKEHHRSQPGTRPPPPPPPYRPPQPKPTTLPVLPPIHRPIQAP